MVAIRDEAEQGFGKEAQAYARGRPEYPEGLRGWLSDTLGVAEGRVALDLGAGTGKFTRLLVDAGATVLAVEPVENMREQLRQRLPMVEALAGSAETIPLPDQSVDVVACAQAFHWFANDKALAEIHRVLKPGGRLGLVWNVRDESYDWVRKISELMTPLEGDTPRFHSGEWRRPFGENCGFSPLAFAVLTHSHVGAPQQVIIDRFRSVSFIAALPDADKQGFLDQLQALIDSHPALQGRAELAFPYRTEAYCCVRLSNK
ncbi:class I SAM-dependent methyltransferase [Chromobacterium sp. IIBBL 290-4]|uniref:class I SAM-dependent methyltransferase n=1 Tax=Chromobacterium sp. IIBBL 290-4 TaxID=2953890 RepID=UPI0020B64999|nr:class I SAM-dependent methyltransferase [Chromobacterium sp. IIBBL 290-4]UTH73284.1 methyltransferase domain-containing protein [Chromobacterium sp. IIBBL 290-4]